MLINRTFTIGLCRAAALTALLAGSSLAARADETATQAQPAGTTAEAPKPEPYLSKAAVPDLAAVVIAPPADGSPAQEAERAIIKQTRALKGQPRWDLAVADADVHPEPLLSHFDCALGVHADKDQAPALHRLFGRIYQDAKQALKDTKTKFARPRPFVTLPGTEICETMNDHLAKSASYPSGHATTGWVAGLVLAELAPDRAGAVMARARSLGESRVVCGVHWPSDIEAGRSGGAALVAALHGDAAFRDDLEKAHAELDAVRASGQAGGSQCDVNDAAVAARPY